MFVRVRACGVCTYGVSVGGVCGGVRILCVRVVSYVLCVHVVYVRAVCVFA